MANSISEFGGAKWWINPLSVFGFYPYSYASSVPFLISGISMNTGIEIEDTIRIYCLFLGLLSILVAYILAGEIWDNDVFKIFVAFSYSLSPGILVFSTWDATTRGLFLIILPLFIFVILRIRISLIKFGLLIIIFFILLMATHHLFFFIFPIFFAYVIAILVNKIKTIKIPNTISIVLILMGFLTMFMIPFFTGLFIEGSRYYDIYLMIENNIRYTGLLAFYSIVGLIYLILKKDKKFGEKFLIISVLGLTIFLYIQSYGHYLIIIFLCLCIGFALTNATKIITKKKYTPLILIITLLISIIFSGYYQHWRTNIGGIHDNWYLDEQSYDSALWIKESIVSGKRLVGNNNVLSKRIFAISGKPIFLEDEDVNMYIYNFTETLDTPIIKNSPFEKKFYMDNPYVIEPGFTLVGWYRNALQSRNVDSSESIDIINRFKLFYVIEDNSISNQFINSISQSKENLYDNGKIKIWSLKG